MIAAAAKNCPALPERTDSESRYAAWLQSQPDATKIAWLAQLMADPRAAVRKAILAEFGKSQPTSSWPIVRRDRTIAELLTAAEDIQHETDRKTAEETARQRAKKLADMAADPMPTIHDTEQLVKQRSMDAYQRIALLLADLREALADSAQSGLAEQQALKLKKNNPTRNLLTAELRRHGFLKK